MDGRNHNGQSLPKRSDQAIPAYHLRRTDPNNNKSQPYPVKRVGNDLISAPITRQERVNRAAIIDRSNLVKPRGSYQAVQFLKPDTPAPRPQPTQSYFENQIEPVAPTKETISIPMLATKQKRKSGRSRWQGALIIMAFMIFAFGLFVNIQGFQTNKNARAQAAALGQSSEDESGSNPSEKRPSGNSNYKVAPNIPKNIKIAAISVNARVRPLGITSKNQLKAPTNIYDVGWYDASAHPGDPDSNGAILMDGHVHGPTLPGVFAGLKKLQVGDIISVTRGDNKVYTYSVVKTQNYNKDKVDMGAALTSAKPGLPGLNLITCGGKVDSKTGLYDQRTVVFAVQQN